MSATTVEATTNTVSRGNYIHNYASKRTPVITTIEEYDQQQQLARSNRRKRAPDDDCDGKYTKRSSSSGILRLWWSRIMLLTRAIMSEDESRRIFMFLLLNLAYMFVQLVYGYLSNSLGLISDAIHMLFDCMALAIGLVAAVVSKWPPSSTFTFGYDRIEILSGFSNGVFLMLISVSIFFEAIERLIHPPEMNTHRLLLVSFGGLFVNLFGMFAFGHHHHGHSHSHSHGHCHDHEHDHNHGDHSHCHHHDHEHSHDHSHGHNHEHHHRSQNMQGVFLHVMADTLGSVGVIISTLLIQGFGWTGFDPLASIVIAGLIFASVVPLVRDSVYLLLLRLPDHSQAQVQLAVDQALQQVDGLPRVQFWPVTETQIMGIVHISVSQDKDQEKIVDAVRSIFCRQVSGLRDVFISINAS